MEFRYESQKFTTKKEYDFYKKECIELMCKHYDVTREQMRLTRGMVLLRGTPRENGVMLNLSTTIGHHADYLKSDNYKEYQIYCRVAQI